MFVGRVIFGVEVETETETIAEAMLEEWIRYMLCMAKEVSLPVSAELVEVMEQGVDIEWQGV